MTIEYDDENIDYNEYYSVQIIFPKEKKLYHFGINH